MSAPSRPGAPRPRPASRARGAEGRATASASSTPTRKPTVVPRPSARPVTGRVPTASTRPGGAAAKRRPSPAVAPLVAPSSAKGSFTAMLTWRSAVVLGVVILALAMLLPALRAYLDQQNSLGALRAEAQTARTEVSDLEAEVERWQDPAFIVAEARERLAYVFPGETPYRVVDPEFVEVAVVQAAQTQAGESDTFDGPWFNALWQSVSAAGNGPDAAESANDVAGDGAAADDVAGDDGPVSDGPATEAPTPGGSEEDGPIGFGE